jgi:hypothetical protein
MTNQLQTSQMTGSEEIVGLVEDDLRDLEVTSMEVRELETHGLAIHPHDERIHERDLDAPHRYRRALRVGAVAGLLVGGLGAGIGYLSLGGAGVTMETTVKVSLGAAAAVLLVTVTLSWFLATRFARD